MQKNLIPLIGIAFVVALVATVVFYGLLVSQMPAEIQPEQAPSTTNIVEADAVGALGIPAGMRAISVQVADSSGVLAMLEKGHRVDVQAVYTRTESEGAVLKTILEGVQVLRVNPEPEPSPGRPALPVVTLVATPEEADILGVADASARLRLVLRNPLDEEKTPRGAISLGTVIRGGATAARQ